MKPETLNLKPEHRKPKPEIRDSNPHTTEQVAMAWGEKEEEGGVLSAVPPKPAPEIRYPELGTRNPKPGTRNSKLKTRNAGAGADAGSNRSAYL
jgi:hypothetical protein